MDREVKEKWVSALNSGLYKQGAGWLCADEHYCCLGVLCEVMGLKKITCESAACSRYSYDDCESSPHLLPTKFANSIGMTPDGTFLDDYGRREILTRLNDTGMSFTDIAKIIEERF